jgi:hypothetical protein
MGDLMHQKESRQLVIVRRLPEIFLEIGPFLSLISNYQVRDDR